MKDKVEVTETTEVIEEIDVGDGADPSYQLDPGTSSYCTEMRKTFKTSSSRAAACLFSVFSVHLSASNTQWQICNRSSISSLVTYICNTAAMARQLLAGGGNANLISALQVSHTSTPMREVKVVKRHFGCVFNYWLICCLIRF